MKYFKRSTILFSILIIILLSIMVSDGIYYKHIQYKDIQMTEQINKNLKDINNIKLKNMYKVSLYFGSDIQGTDRVTLDQWKKFLDKYVNPIFDGYNINYSYGYWKKIPEDTYEIHMTVSSYNEISEKIEFIRNKYKKQFNQESVLLEVYAIYGEF